MSLIIFSIISFLANANAATFLPIEIAERMKNSDAAIFGEYNGQSYKRLPTGEVVTEYSFKVEKFSGLRPNEIISKNTYKVIVPGGIWNNEVHKVSGTPKFKLGEKVVLMVKKGPYGHMLPDLAMSKFKVIRKDNESILTSDIFPNTYNVGQISLRDFNKIAVNVYGKKLKVYNSDKFIYKRIENNSEKKNGRYIASVGNEDNSENERSFSFMWLILALAVSGFVANIVSKGNKEQ